MMRFFLFLVCFSTIFAQASITEEEITYDWLISQSPRGGYTDHIPHFRELFQHYKVKTLLEFGMGYSTKYFLNHLSKVISVEFVTYGSGPTWLHELLQLYKNDSNWVPIAYLSQAPYDTTKIPFKFFGSDAVYKADAYQCSTHEDYSLIDPSYLREMNSFISNLLKCHSVDCVFVDSGTCLRGDLVSLLFSKVPVIIAHDTYPRTKGEKDVYGYSRIVTPSHYEEIYIPKGQGTTIWIKKDPTLEPLIDAMKKYSKRSNDKQLDHFSFETQSLEEYHFARGSEIQEGYITEGQKKQFGDALKKHPQIRAIAEIGLNGEHSAEHFLKNCPNLTSFTSFDIQYWSYTDAAVDFLKTKYGNRFCFIPGDSVITIPEFAGSHTETKFDLIYIDGNHSYLGCLADITNCQSIATKDSLLWIDDYESPEIQQAVATSVFNGMIAVDRVHKEDRHWIEAHYLFKPYPFIHRKSPYYTHQPLLYEISKQTSGPIIEFGCGDGSTDLLHEMCKQNQRQLISLDDDEDWLNIFRGKYKEDKWHQFLFVPGKPSKDSDSPQHWIDFMNQSDVLKSTSFDVCFIDQHPWLGRFETLKFMKDKARFIILHDCDYFPTNRIFGTTIVPNSDTHLGVFDFSGVFQHFKVYPACIWPGPPTLLGSDVESTLLDLDFNAY